MKVNASVYFGPEGLLPSGLIAEIKHKAQVSMALAFHETVDNNFGIGPGEDRPLEWPLLSPWYAEIAHDGDRTPKLQLTGVLQGSIEVDEFSTEASVYTDCEYAEKHQFGDPSIRLPARPFFPLEGSKDSSEVTELTTQKCLHMAEIAAIDAIKSHFRAK